MRRKLHYIPHGQQEATLRRHLLSRLQLRQRLCLAQAKGELQSFQDSCAASDIIVAEGLQEERAVRDILEATRSVPTVVAFGCAPGLQGAMRLGGVHLADNG